ncbi:GTPase HflX [Facklamia languida]|uniref:GTPase HflX n=1 Tax=Facklamia languida CCUG 37842 TaxID=883113 RepID=H3NHT3_9LACT|nr:GTPase HflX [Facklamia languida]EHR37732.1 GTP-binding protein HflX [Facklamia languida CCUG 37842]
MIEVDAGVERVMIVGVQTDRYEEDQFEEMMQEMVDLAQTAQGKVVCQVRQKLPHLDHRYAVGPGKLEEIKLALDHHRIDLVIFFNPLSPSMNRSIETVLQVRVIDRVQLILDIFALRAKSMEGQLQVSLAQYEYLLPRITGQGKMLSRLGGGIGTRGPGETQLESDRRHIRSQITHIKRSLDDVANHRERTRSKRQRSREFNIGLVGYTNAGKSTIMHQLTGTDTYVQDQLFATLDPLTRQFSINGHPVFTLTDTVGFIEELPTELIEAFKSTLEEIRYLDLLLHVVDASNPAHTMHEETVLRILRDLEVDHLPILTVYNKSDCLNQPFNPTISPNVLISAKNDQDMERLKEAIWRMCLEEAEEYSVRIRPEDADRIAIYQQRTLVTSLEFNEEENYYQVSGFRKLFIVD